MKTILAIAGIAGFAAAASANGNIVIAETLWDSDNTLQGWTFTDNGLGSWDNPGADGNPGGYARYTDVASNMQGPSLFAPGQYLGDYSSYIGGCFTYDIRLEMPSNDPGLPSNYPRIRLQGSDGSEARALANFDLTTDWTSVQINILESDWEMVSGTWNGLIGDVSGLYFGGDFLLGSGPEGAVDNFRLLVPAPGAGALLGLGGLAMARRRR